MFLNIVKFLGRFHPVVVHLPIGILLAALLLQSLARREKYATLEAAVPMVLFVGMLSAFAACITGYLLWLGGGYDVTESGWHMWMGISVAMVSVLLYARRKTGRIDATYRLMSVGLFVLIVITGHLGGSLTHGSDYLSSALTGAPETARVRRPPIADVQQAMVFADVIQPILADKCTGCHGATKQKGRLRMDSPELLMVGGKHGAVIKAGKAGESELIKRILLPADDDHHMAPKDKSQLTRHEIDLLSWWISAGAPFNKRVSELPQPDKIKPALLALQESGEEGDATALINKDVPAEEVAAPNAKAIASLKQKGIMVLPIAQNSHYLEVSCVNDTALNDRDMVLLKPIASQLFSLKLSHTSITDSSMAIIASFPHLVRLHLDHTAVTDRGLAAFGFPPQLKYLNLAGTSVTAAGVRKLQPLRNLQTVYLYQAQVNKKEWLALQTLLKNVRLDSGAYVVPLLPVDTVIVKPAPKK